MKRKESNCAIGCYFFSGPTFGGWQNEDLIIDAFCIADNSCSIQNDGTNSYECHPEYRSSLFVNTARPDETNKFSVLDYEVYTYK